MKKYTVPITYMRLHCEEVEAENIQQAVNKAITTRLNSLVGVTKPKGKNTFKKLSK